MPESPAQNVHLLAIGLFVFGMDRLSFGELARTTSWRHGMTDRYAARAAGQYLGPGEEKITLNGLLVPEIAGTFGDIERLREMAGAGEIYPVVLGDGTVLGHFRIVNVDDRWSNLIGGGRPRTTEFAVDLIRADDAGTQTREQIKPGTPAPNPVKTLGGESIWV